MLRQRRSAVITLFVAVAACSVYEPPGDGSGGFRGSGGSDGQSGASSFAGTSPNTSGNAALTPSAGSAGAPNSDGDGGGAMSADDGGASGGEETAGGTGGKSGGAAGNLGHGGTAGSGGSTAGAGGTTGGTAGNAGTGGNSGAGGTAGMAGTGGTAGSSGAAGSGGTSGSAGTSGAAGAGGTSGGTTYRYVKLLAKSEQYGHVWTSIAEFQVLTTGGNALDRTGWTVTADSEELSPEVAPATNAIDGDNATYWHTYWETGGSNDAPLPHYLIVDLGAAATVTGFTYLPRQNSGNGRIKEWEFYVSNSGTTWGSPVKTGSFPDGTARQTVTF